MGEPAPLAVHRCRFVDFAPSAITALAFPPLPLPSVKGKKPVQDKQPLAFGTLAIGRANGNIDLCEWSGPARQVQAPQAWVVRKTLAGPYPSKVDSLSFVLRHPERFGPDDVPTCAELRLFSSGGGSELIEWDMEKGCVRRTISSQGGSIWSMAANPASNMIALGCEDGAVRLLSLVHDSLTHHRRFDKVKCRLLSLAWGPPVAHQVKPATETTDSDSDSDDDEDDWTDSWLVTGGSDSSLRKWDVASGRVLDRMGTDKMRGERTLVWTVGVLGDGTIVSGDSLGMVKFWDARTATQLQSFQAHGADVLCLTMGPEGTTVFTSGVDQKVVQFTHVKTSNPGESSLLSSSSRWVQTCSRRMHSHDVRALATWPPYTPLPPSHKRQFPLDIAPILASGGLDMSVVLTPAALPTSTVVKIVNPLCTSVESTFEDSYHRRLSYTPGHGFSVAKGARLLSCMRDNGVSVWRISKKQFLEDEEDLVNGAHAQEMLESGGWERVLDMDLNVHTTLAASCMSDDGKWLVVSDLYETKLFSIQTDNKGNLKPKRIRDFTSILLAQLPGNPTSTGGAAFSFTPDSSKLVMTTTMSAHVLIIDLGNTDNQKPRVLRRFDHHRMKNTAFRDRVVAGRKDKELVQATDAGDVEMGSPGEKEDDDASDDTPVAANIARVAISADGQWLATSDDRLRTHVFNLDSVQHQCVLPSFTLPVQSMSFDPTHPNILIMAFPSNTLQFYNVESRQFPSWSKPLIASLPKRFTHTHEPIIGVTFDPASSTSDGAPTNALFWGSTWICKIKIDHVVAGGLRTRKRRRDTRKAAHVEGDELDPRNSEGGVAAFDLKMVTHYRPILHVDFLAAGELVVVERPLVDVLATLPPAYYKHKYGAS